MSAQLKDKAFTNAQRSTHRYGTIELEEDWSDDEINDLEDDHDYELVSILFDAYNGIFRLKVGFDTVFFLFRIIHHVGLSLLLTNGGVC